MVLRRMSFLMFGIAAACRPPVNSSKTVKLKEGRGADVKCAQVHNCMASLTIRKTEARCQLTTNAAREARMVETIIRGWEGLVTNNSSIELGRFLLIYRGRRTIRTLVIEAASLTEALGRAQEICGDQFQLRMVQALGPDLANLVRPEQVNRALSPAGAAAHAATRRTHARRHVQSACKISRLHPRLRKKQHT